MAGVAIQKTAVNRNPDIGAYRLPGLDDLHA